MYVSLIRTLLFSIVNIITVGFQNSFRETVLNVSQKKNNNLS